MTKIYLPMLQILAIVFYDMINNPIRHLSHLHPFWGYLYRLGVFLRVLLIVVQLNHRFVIHGSRVN